jgi:hypothetical protein
LNVVAGLRVAHAALGLSYSAGGKVVDGEGDDDAVLVAWEGLGFEEPEDFLVVIGVAIAL